MKDQSDRTPDGDVNPGGAASPNFGAGGSRRRFIKGGAAAAPVILTFTSRPVLGFEQACLSPSRMISGNHSGFRGPDSCGGLSRDEWARQVGTNDQLDLVFTEVFVGSNPYDSDTDPLPTTLGEVLLDSIANKDKNEHSVPGFASYIIAAYLNSDIEIGSVTVLKPAQVKHMWNDVIAGVGFCPQPGGPLMCWNAKSVIGYLTNSGIVPE